MQLGPFTIDDFIARGAAGEVWRGRHARHGTPVALKIIQTGDDAEAELPAEVRTELEALAGMAHPNIVWVHDFGRVPTGIHTATGETLPEGAVWLAMELADRDLKDPGPFTWPQLKGWTDQLLDALGYAHARGVLHRDVKPQNVLLSGPDQTLKLSDFGIAVVRGETRHVAAGTMYYMAPEQELGDLPQLVPATDLFALGVMIWRMLCGKVPYKSMGATFLFQKMKGNFLPFEPTIPVPTDLEDWLKACMAPAPPDRFACAADARHALELLKSPRTGARRAPVVLEEEEDEATIVELATTAERPAILGKRPPPAPMVTDWKRNAVETPHLLNAGLELFGMRAFPTVGREKEREALWRALVEVRRSREPKVVVISGASGMGRKHLARWVGERGAETGASNLVRLSFAGGAGIVTWLQGEFRCTETDEESLAEALNSHEARFGPLPQGATQAIRRALQERTVDGEVYEAFAHVIALHTSDRPAVVVLQDAITPECWNAVRAVRDHEVRLPVLFVASVRDDLRDRVPDIGAESIELEPLQEDHRVPFIRQLLGLEPALSVRLARITAGSPGFAISVCDHWARQGVLEPGPRGYRLADGAGAELPTNESWVAQLDELAALSASYTPLLGTAAILGPDVNTTIWAETTEHPENTGALLTELVRRRLARRTETGFTFTQAAFREAILGKIAPSLQQLAGVCADVLARHGGNEERLAWSLLQAKRWEEATEALFAGARRATANGRFHDVIDLLDRWPEVSAERTLDPADTRNADAMILRLRALQSLGRLPVLRGLAEEAVFVAPLHGWKDLEAWGRVLLARWQLKGDERFDYLQKALALLLDLPESVLHAETFLELAQFERDRGNLELSVQHNHTATKVAKALKLPNMPRFQSDEARGLALLGRYDDALALAAEAESGALANGGIWTQAMAVFQIGEILFSMEDYPKAQDEFKRSMLLFRRIGDGHEWYLRAMMALAILMQGDKRTAQGHFEACLVAPIRYGDFVAWLGLLSIDENSKSWNLALDKLYEKFIDKGYSNHVFARMFEVAGDFCVGIGARERAASAYTAARQQRAAMGGPTEELDTILARLPTPPAKGAKAASS